MENGFFGALVATVLVMLTGSMVSGKSLKAPPGLFKDLNDQIVGDAIIINGKQLFIDDYVIEELKGAEKVLNQPTKHPKNPLIVADKPWEGLIGYSSLIYDRAEGFFKMWYHVLTSDGKKQVLCYATSPDGIRWRKPITPGRARQRTNIVFGGSIRFNSPTVFKDATETDPERRYKMMYRDYLDGTRGSASTNVAFSPDGILWKPHPQNPVIPFSDSHCCPLWDPLRSRYVAFLRYGPPNERKISMVESEDFVHWSPKVTIFRRTKVDRPFKTKLYQMEAMLHAGVYLGFMSTYHGETIKPIPRGKQAWMDKVDVQLTFSRNGRTWLRVGKRGAIPHAELRKERDWKAVAEQAAFIPWGAHGKDWDWGSIYPLQAPLVVNDEIWVYYVGYTGRHWAKYHGDPPKTSGIGLATLRLDGFVSIDADTPGTMTTKKFVFIGDTLEVNANAKGGSIVVEALDGDGKVIEGFSKADCQAITTDSVRHVLKWKGKKDCHLIQARPIRLRFHMKKAKLYSFTPRIRHKHYVQSYD